MTEHDKTPRKTRNDNEGGREFGHVHSPSQAQLASQNRGLADDSIRSDVRRKTPLVQHEASAMNPRRNGAQRSSPPGKAARDKRQHKRAA
ncbi:MAG TPA: hypothetical protein VFT88_02690 [Acidobacteriaceae bacterium]|jgi:hypothetical protein|nr:hypothetical protein [Acidobacteriaceae bacterium]